MHQVGGGGQPKFMFEDVAPYVIAGDDYDCDSTFLFADHINSTGQLVYPLDQNFVYVNIPMHALQLYLSVHMALKVAHLHHISVGSHVPKSEIAHFFEGHDCASCNLYLSVFSVHPMKYMHCKEHGHKKHNIVTLNLDPDGMDNVHINHAKSGVNVSHSLPISANTENIPACPLITDPNLDPASFPPLPPADVLSQEIIADLCACSSPDCLEEAGCAICGQLVCMSQLSKLKSIKNLLHVLDYHCSQVCDHFHQSLWKGKAPHNSLSTGLWLGEVLEELLYLSYVEKMLVTHVHINSLFVHVVSSRAMKDGISCYSI